jgi:hypothetical protein
VNGIGEFLYGEHTPESKAWLSEHLHRLKHEGPDELLPEFQALQQQHPDSQAICGNLAYLEKRKAQIQYPHFQAQGWPIGSSIVESGNKLVVEARLKGSGMHWAEACVNPMLAIRNIICSDRWQEEWPKIEARLRQQTRQQRSRLHQSRSLPTQTSPSRLTPRLDAKLVQALSKQFEQQDVPKKLKNNPWRNFKHGKALYQHSSPPKK